MPWHHRIRWGNLCALLAVLLAVALAASWPRIGRATQSDVRVPDGRPVPVSAAPSP